VYAKMQRVENIAIAINEKLSEEFKTDSEKLKKAAKLMKADLVTDMVFEYGEMQGVIGRIYAEHDKEDKEVSQAIEEHYWPLTNDGKLPKTKTGTILALADKLDTLFGYFSVGIQPSGSADPYGLRRLAVGVLRILTEKQIPVKFEELFDIMRANAFAPSKPEFEKNIKEFLRQRIENMLETRGFKFDEVRAVISTGYDDLIDVQERLEALKKIRKMPDFEPLAAAFKRTANILKQAKKNNFPVSDSVNESLFKEEAETKLYASIRNIETNVKASLEKRDYLSALKDMVSIKSDVDEFFIKVMVMAEDVNLRQNRLSILKYIENLFFKVLDFSQLQ
jgi:glycyl-tRNA synthetase beta chain